MEKNKSYIDQRLKFTNYIIHLVSLFFLLQYSFKEQLRLLTHRALSSWQCGKFGWSRTLVTINTKKKFTKLFSQNANGITGRAAYG